MKAYHTLEKPNIAKLARESEVTYQRLRARIHGRENKTASASLKNALDSIQEKALRTWIDTLHIGDMAIPPSLIERLQLWSYKAGGESRLSAGNSDNMAYGGIPILYMITLVGTMARLILATSSSRHSAIYSRALKRAIKMHSKQQRKELGWI